MNTDQWSYTQSETLIKQLEMNESGAYKAMKSPANYWSIVTSTTSVLKQIWVET